MKDKLIEVFGWYGTIAIIGTYALASFEIVKPHSILYQTLNITGALGIVFVSLRKKTYQPAVLNIIWTIVGIAALSKILIEI